MATQCAIQWREPRRLAVGHVLLQGPAHRATHLADIAPMKMRPALLLICLCGSLTCGAQWVLDNNWSEGGRQIGASDRWEVPVALDRTNGSVVMLSAAYDSSGTAEVRWRGFSASNGSPLWTGSGFQGETPVDLRTSFFEDRWFLFSGARGIGYCTVQCLAHPGLSGG